MKPEIPLFSPPQVRKKFLKDNKILDSKLKGDISQFSISKIEDIYPYLSLPNSPFRNTSHGFIFVITGSLKISIDIMELTLNQNMLIFTPAGQVNNIESIDLGTKGFFVTFHDNFFENSQLELAPIISSGLLDPAGLYNFYLTVDLQEIILAICKRMIYLYQGSKDNRSLIRRYMLTLLEELTQIFQKERMVATQGTSRLVMQFKDILLKNIKNNPGPADLAEKLNVSTNHLNKVLKSNTQLSTSEWIAKRQIIEAKLMLKHSNSPISEIAYHLGFDDPSYFSKFFHRHTNLTPSIYRNS